MATGTIDDPLTLTEALADSRIEAGHTVWLRQGTYSADFISTLVGTAESPITIRPMTGETAIIDGALDVNGEHTIWRDLIFRYTGWTKRDTLLEGPHAADMPTQSINTSRSGVKFINCIIHDMIQGPGIWISTLGITVYGCVIFNNGWSGPVDDRGQGHGIYTQALSDSPHVFKDNIIFHNFSTGIKMYNEASDMRGFQVYGNTCFCTGVPYNPVTTGDHHLLNIWVGGNQTQTEIDIQNNMTYHRADEGESNAWGWVNSEVTIDNLSNNYMPEGYISGDPDTVITVEEGNYTGPGAGNTYFLRANDYDATRANLTIYNEAGADSVAVDVSAIFDVGDTLALWSVLAGVDASGVRQDVTEYTVAGDGTIAVDMRAVSHTVAAPYEWDAPATTFPTFGAFIVTKL